MRVRLTKTNIKGESDAAHSYQTTSSMAGRASDGAMQRWFQNLPFAAWGSE